jgi:hypothetical protein
VNAPNCPECTGPWLDGWRWQHGTGCPIRAADDATQARDRGPVAQLRGGPYARPATANEARLYAHATGRTLPAGALTVIYPTPGYWARAIAGRPSATS